MAEITAKDSQNVKVGDVLAYVDQYGNESYSGTVQKVEEENGGYFFKVDRSGGYWFDRDHPVVVLVNPSEKVYLHNYSK